jgi:ferredoxin
MGVNPSLHPSSPECIRCGDCVRACPVEALRLGIPARKLVSNTKSGVQEGKTP